MRVGIVLIRVWNFFKILFNDLADLIYKKKCLECGCSINEGILCKTCLKTVEKLSTFQQGIFNGYRLYSVFYYKGVIKTLIHKMKFNHRKDCAFYSAMFIYDFLKELTNNKEENINLKNAVIVPVRTHKNNKYKRGYDHVLEIGRELSKILSVDIAENAILKTKFTPPQYTMTAKQRETNPIGSFALDCDFKTDNLVILLDDVVTTGATLKYITSLFKEKGIKNLICLTLAKTKIN